MRASAVSLAKGFSKVRARVEGVMAQGADPEAAARTRPFFTDEDRLAEAFPAEHRESIESLTALLVEPLSQVSAARRSLRPAESKAQLDAEVVRSLTFATLHDHLLRARAT
ncbi:MAG: hypothetical protein ACRDV4_00320 [Acidimicrobiales bacterium]